MKKIILKTHGLDCPNCAQKLEDSLAKMDGISYAKVVFVTGKIELGYRDDLALKNAKEYINQFEDVKIIENDHIEVKKWDLITIIIASVFFILTFVISLLSNGITSEIVNYIGYGLTYLIIGYPVLINTFRSLKKGQIFDENFLMTLASIGAILVSIFSEENQMMEAAAVMLLYQIGEYLQKKAVGSSRNTIQKLIEMKSETANLFVDGIIKTVDPVALKVGDRIVIKAGEKIPVDCKITSGNSSVDMKYLTGEARLIDVKVGDELLSGSINVSGRLFAVVTKEFNDSTVAKILDLVENSAASKAKPELFITKFAKYYTPVVCIIAFSVAVFAPLIEFMMTNTFHISDWIIKALSILVISCPCALIISVPLTYFSGIGACAKKGILAKGATRIDELSQTEVILLDKTGTLTKGVFTVKRIVSDNVELLTQVSSAIEKYSNHPLSIPLTKYPTNLVCEDVKEIAGYGIVGYIDEKRVLVGNAKFLKEHQVVFEELDSLSTVTYVSYDNKYLGAFEIDDEVKPEVNEFLDKLPKVGIKKRVMLTGDNALRAASFAKEYPIDVFYGSLLPADKLRVAQNYQKNEKIMFVGDGINDSPVMTIADCSFSMGQLGSDAAVEASDFVLINDNLNGIIETIKISRKTRLLVWENIIGSILIKVTIMILGFFGLIPLWGAVLADVGVMLVAVLNALRVRL